MKRVHDAVTPMQTVNEDMKMEFNADEPSLTIETHMGKFILSTNHVDHTMGFMSYISGKNFYFFAEEEKEEGRWLNVRDGHDFIGLLTRDLIKHCRGCPKID